MAKSAKKNAEVTEAPAEATPKTKTPAPAPEVKVMSTDAEGAMLVSYGKREFRVTRTDEGALDVRTFVSKRHPRGHQVEYWKSVRRGSKTREAIESALA